MSTINTVAQFRKAVSGGVVTNDRGNGCGGPGYIAEHDDCEADGEIVELVSEDKAPWAWQLAREALAALDLPSEPEMVAIGIRAPGDNGYQEIYCG